MNIINNKKGIIDISPEVLDTMPLEMIKMFFSNFYPHAIVRGHDLNANFIKYFGRSEHFEEVKEGGIIPNYIACFNQEQDGKYTIEFNKI